MHYTATEFREELGRELDALFLAHSYEGFLQHILEVRDFIKRAVSAGLTTMTPFSDVEVVEIEKLLTRLEETHTEEEYDRAWESVCEMFASLGIEADLIPPRPRACHLH